MPPTDPRALRERLFGLLVADAPHPSLGAHADTYARLIGSWRGDYRDLRGDGAETGPMEVHFAWALEGRAVQDVWLAPFPAGPGDEARQRRTYGTTLRVFDPQHGCWRTEWFNPARNVRCSLVGRRVGDDIVQTGYWDDRPQRWRFARMRADSFLWQAHTLDDDGEQWSLRTEFVLHRIAAGAP